MKQIVTISGKGGTGKTILTAAFSAIAKNHVMADCDVDAADLHLLLSPDIKERHLFQSGLMPKLDRERCSECRQCVDHCRFHAIRDDLSLDPLACEGCRFCEYVCPMQAISMEKKNTGEWYLSETRFGPLIHARLGAGEENSGKLVSLVRKEAKETALKQGADWVLIDGSPGIGCPVIASLSDVDYAVVVIEPSLSGLHDAGRVIEVAKHFGVKSLVVINKYDLHQGLTTEIERFCGNRKIPVLGKIPFDKAVVEMMGQAKTIMETGKSEAKTAIIEIWNRLGKMIHSSGIKQSNANA
ncbi:MAG: ATP-binding protein [Candidatus Omnitrophica bacterium]|nr:ATP-binding protein [Candidatus Omnitrophota bacterium]